METRNNGVVLNLWLAVMLGLLVVWKSAMRSDVMARLHQEGNKMQRFPSFKGYEAHFPAIIPDLSVFLKVRRNKEGKVGVGGRYGNGKRKIPKKIGRAHTITNDGLYVLDVLNNWVTSVKVTSGILDEIDVVLEPGQAWTQELVTYKTIHMELTFSLQCRIVEEGNDRTLFLTKEPFAGVANPAYPNPLVRRLTGALPCRFFRLSKWVFSRNIGALAVIYVQMHQENNNRLARLFVMHVPKEKLRPKKNGRLPKGWFDLWVFQNATDLDPVPLNQVDIEELVLNMNSHANIIEDAESQTFNRNDYVFHNSSIQQERSHNLASHQYCGSYEQPSNEGSSEYQLPYWTKDERDEISEAAQILMGMKGDN